MTTATEHWPIDATEAPVSDDAIVYVSESAWPQDAVPMAWRVPLRGDAWAIVEELDAYRLPWELHEFDHGLDYFVTVPNGKPLADIVLQDAGCTPSDSLWSLLDGGLQGVDLAASQYHGSILPAAGRTLRKLLIFPMLFSRR